MIYSYFEHCEGRDPDEEFKLMAYWRQHHLKLGIETKILSEYHARKHKDFAGYDAAIDALIQSRHAESRATFMRWLAMATVAGGRGVYMQYNTFLYPTVWDDLNPIFHLTGQDVNTLRMYHRSRPSLVVGTEQTYFRQAERFATCKLVGATAGITDHAILSAQSVNLPDSMNCMSFVEDYGAPNWKTAVVVHYPRALLNRDGFHARHVAIPDLRRLVIPE